MKISKLKELFEDESLKYALATNIAKYGRPQSKKSDKKAKLTKGLEKKREKAVKDLKKSMGEQDMGSPFPIPDIDDKGYIAARKLIDQLRLTTFRKLNPDELESFRREIASAFDMILKEAKEIKLDDKEQEIVNDILSNVSEGATATRVIDKFKDYARKGLLTMSIILGVVQGLEAQDTVQSDIDKIQQTGTELIQQQGGNTAVRNPIQYDLEAKKAKSLLGSEYEKYEEFAKKYNLIMVVRKTDQPYGFIQNSMSMKAKSIATDENGKKYWERFEPAKVIVKDDIVIRMYSTKYDDYKAAIDVEINENNSKELSGLDRIKFYFDKLYGPDLRFRINRDPNNPERDRIDVFGSQQDLMDFGSALQGEKMEGYEVFWTDEEDRGQIVRIIKSDSINEKKKKDGDRCLRIARRKMPKTSAYRSGLIVKCRKGMIWKKEK